VTNWKITVISNDFPPMYDDAIRHFHDQAMRTQLKWIPFMKDALVTRLLRVQPAEVGLTLTLGFLLLINAMAQQISGVVAVSGFLSEVGTNQILIVWIVNYTLITLVAAFQSLLVDRFNRITLIGAVCLSFAGIFVALRLMFAAGFPSWLTYSLIYIISDQQWLFFPLVFWVLANDAVDMAQAKRLFPLFASIGVIGKIGGIIIAGIAPTLLMQIRASSVELTTFIALLYLFAFVIVRTRLRGVKIRQTVQKEESLRKRLDEAQEFINDIPLYKYLSYSVAALIVCHIIIEFHFMVVSSQQYPDGVGFQQFYSVYRLGVAVMALLLQTFITSRLIEKLTLKNVFLIMPIAVTIGLTWMIALPGFISGVAGMVLNRLPRDAVDDAAQKSLLAMVPEERRGRVALFMDNGMIGLGSVLGCIIALVVVAVGPAVLGENYALVYLFIGIVAAIIGIVCVFKARSQYDKSLLSWRLKRRQRNKSILEKLEF
jgi:ATP/ADP translocase